MAEQERLVLTVKETAEALQLSEDVVYTLAHRRDFPAFRVGRAIRINRRGLEEWVAKQNGKEL